MMCGVTLMTFRRSPGQKLSSSMGEGSGEGGGGDQEGLMGVATLRLFIVFISTNAFLIMNQLLGLI